jgi:hypothetical protein
MTTIRFDVNTPRLGATQPGQAREILREELGEAAFELVNLMAADMQAHVPVAFATLYKHILTSRLSEAAASLGGAEVSIGTPASRYAPYVEYGSSPHWTSVKNLQAWANLRGRNVYAVQWGIAQRGTRPQAFFWPAVERLRPEAAIAMSVGLSRAVQRLEQLS